MKHFYSVSHNDPLCDRHSFTVWDTGLLVCYPYTPHLQHSATGPGPSSSCTLLYLFFSYPEAEFLDEIQTKVLRAFLLTFQKSPLYNFALRFLFLQTHGIFYSFYSVTPVKEKGGKSVRKPHSFPYGLRNPYRNIKFENSQDYALKPQRNLHEIGFC